MRLYSVTFFAYAASAFRQLLASVSVQILRILLMAAVDAAVKQVLARLLTSVTAVDIFRIIEFLQTPVIKKRIPRRV